MNSTRFRHGFVYLLIILAVAVIILGAFARQQPTAEWDMTELKNAIQEGRVAEIVVQDNNELEITLTDGNLRTSMKGAESTAAEQLAALGVTPEQLASVKWVNQKSTNWSDRKSVV